MGCLEIFLINESNKKTNECRLFGAQAEGYRVSHFSPCWKELSLAEFSCFARETATIFNAQTIFYDCLRISDVLPFVN